MTQPQIAIIGAGMSGLILAHALKNVASVALFEKSRGVSGRMSTRYADPYQFDHGAQFFTAKTEAFRTFLEPLLDGGMIAPWYARFVELDRDQITGSRQWSDEYPHYVAVPKMNHLCKHLATDLGVHLNTRVGEIHRADNGWEIRNETHASLGVFDWVISTAPPEQTTQLMPATFQHISAIQSIKALGCYALMLGFEEPLNLSWDAALVRNADISWISVNSSKPGRPAGYSIIAQATNSWADAHMEDDIETVQAHLQNELAIVIGCNIDAADYVTTHRWRYANLPKQCGPQSLIDTDNRLAACGDWCIQGRVESAFTSAMHLAEKMMPFLTGEARKYG